jgi:hypothetical protein
MPVNTLSSPERASFSQTLMRQLLAEPLALGSKMRKFYHLERRDLSSSEARWNVVETGWKMDNEFTDARQAEDAARALALHAMCDVAIRVIDPAGNVEKLFVVLRSFLIAEGDGAVSEQILPFGYDAPMVSEVLENSQARQKVYPPYGGA